MRVFTTLLAATMLVSAGAGALAKPAAHRPAKPADGPISAQRLSDDVKVLASDDFQGRSPATPGETRTVDWLISQFKAMGLQPGGEHGGWTQTVPIHRYTIASDAKLSLAAGDWSRPLVQGDDAVAVTMRPIDRVQIDKAPLVFVGYGVSAPERQWDDFKGVDLHGKIAVVLVNDPDFENPSSDLFGGKAMTYYGRWMYKYEEAVRRGALGMLIVHETAGAGYAWTIVKNSNTGAQYDIVRADPAHDKLLMQGWLQRDVAVELFRHAGLDFEALKEQAKTRDFHPVTLTGANFSADYAVKTEKTESRNVIARLPGKTHPDETILYSAHWDHFGVGQPDATGDRIYHGADDDGTGVAAVLELARAFKAAPKVARTVVFIAWTGEERGFLGSGYYVEHPVYPLARTVANINMDVLQTAGPAHDVILVGPGKDTLEDDLAAAAKARGRYVTAESHPEVGSFYRGDQFPLAKLGVPVLPLMAMSGGPDLIKGGRAAGEAWAADYTAHHYHTPQDRWSADWDLRGAASDVDLAYDVGRTLANSRTWPTWKAGSEFAAIRTTTDATRSAR